MRVQVGLSLYFFLTQLTGQRSHSARFSCSGSSGAGSWRALRGLSERGEEDILVLQTPAPRHDSGTSAMPCPCSLSNSRQEKHRAFELIWKHFLIHIHVVFLETLQGETQLK